MKLFLFLSTDVGENIDKYQCHNYHQKRAQMDHFRSIKCGPPLPHRRVLHVAVRWKKTIIIWGGCCPDGVISNSEVLVHLSGKWIGKETSGDVPTTSQYLFARAQGSCSRGHSVCVGASLHWFYSNIIFLGPDFLDLDQTVFKWALYQVIFLGLPRKDLFLWKWFFSRSLFLQH